MSKNKFKSMMLEEQYGTCKHANTGMHAPQGLQTLQPMQTMQGQDSLDSQEAAEQLTPLSEWHDNYEVMEMFHISARTLQTLRSNGKLPFAKMGGRCYYKERDLQRLMDESYRDSRMKGGALCCRSTECSTIAILSLMW